MTGPATVQNAGLGIVLMLVTYAFFAGVDTSVKWLVTLGIPAFATSLYALLWTVCLDAGGNDATRNARDTD